MYLDDCIVYGKGEAEFLKNLNKVFERFRLKGLRLKAKKCRFGLPRIELRYPVNTTPLTMHSTQKYAEAENMVNLFP